MVVKRGKPKELVEETILDNSEPVETGNDQESNGEESPNMVMFEENGEMIEMEINGSEEGFNSEFGTEAEMESDIDTDNEVEVDEITDDLQNEDIETNVKNNSKQTEQKQEKSG